VLAADLHLADRLPEHLAELGEHLTLRSQGGIRHGWSLPPSAMDENRRRGYRWYSYAILARQDKPGWYILSDTERFIGGDLMQKIPLIPSSDGGDSGSDHLEAGIVLT
jgi:hypothetical protein